MPETIPADIAAAIDIFHLRALREGKLGIGTQASSEAANAASEARKRLDAAIAMHLRSAERACDSYARENQQLSDRVDELKAAMDAITSGAA